MGGVVQKKVLVCSSCDQSPMSGPVILDQLLTLEAPLKVETVADFEKLPTLLRQFG